jgi:type I restriction enzyme R subunit
VALIRSYNNIAPEMKEAGYSDAEAEQIKQKVNDYVELRTAIKAASGEYIDLKKYEPDMRQLLDMYLNAEHSRVLSNFEDATLLQIIVQHGIGQATSSLPKVIKSKPGAVAETLEANMRKVIIQEMPINPVYYERMSVLLQELIRMRKNEALAFEQYLAKIEELAKKIQPGNNQNQYPKNINTPAKQALFEILKNEELTLVMEADVAGNIEENFIGNTLKERKVKRAIVRHVTDPELVEQIFEVIKNQKEYR